MSTDRDARVLAAAEGIDVTLPDGTEKHYTLRPIVAQHLCDLEREALSFYRKQYMETFKEAVDAGLLDQDAVLAQISKAASWSVEDLPQKLAYDGNAIPATPELRTWVEDRFSDLIKGIDMSDDPTAGRVTSNGKLSDLGLKAVVVTALDNGLVKPEDVEAVIGTSVPRQRVRFDQWWVTATPAGMIRFIWTAVKYEHADVSVREIGDWPITSLTEGARLVENITAAAVKNL